MTPPRTIALLLVLLLAPISRAEHPVSAGVSSITTGGNPASMVVWGDATPLIVREDGRVFAAATSVGNGRVVTLGHTGYFNTNDPGTNALIAQALEWMHDGEDPARVFGLTQQRLDALGADATSVGGTVRDIVLTNVDILVCSPQEWNSAGRLDDVRTFLEKGGGTIIGECAWGQLQLGRAKDTEDLAANRLLVKHGVIYTDRVESGTCAHIPGLVGIANATSALDALVSKERVTIAARVVSEALRAVPDDTGLMRTVRAMRQEHKEEIDSAYTSMASTPLKPGNNPLAYALLAYDARTWSVTDGAHPSAAAFPGAHDPDAKTVAPTLTIDPSYPGWHSTGLWLPAGGTAELLVHMQSADPGVSLRVGCWLDPQDFDERVRMTEASRVSRATDDPGMHVLRPRASVFSPIGGPVYVELEGLRSYRDAFQVNISGVIQMPHFTLNETTLDEWNAMMANPSAPWCELESDELVFTLPVDMVKQCERPDLVMEHWDRVHRAMHELNPRSPNHWPNGKYRYVADKKLSWGYMYCPSNAPIVIPMTAADEMVDLDEYDAEGPTELWGHYHEMGHAHQSDAWTFGGTTEVTVNIFTVYALHTVNGYPLDSEHLRTTPAEAWKRFQQHQADGAPFDTWKSDPFLALQTYAMLWHEFGFDAFKETFARYRDGRVALPTDDQQERDTFVRTFSEVVGRDLSGYFEAWGVPISASVGESLAGLEAWMPVEPE